MKIDKDKFLFLYQNEYGTLNLSQHAGLALILDSLESDIDINDIRWAAYMLATVKWECGGTWKPIAEFDKGTGKKYGLPDKDTGKVYYGRGYVQLTWKENYAAMGRVFGLDFANEPDLVMRPEVAYQIMSYGMRKGSFTGVKLAMYIHDDVCDYLHGRKIINGMDKADLIAGFAVKIEAMLKEASV